ncbi:hypothetical protein TEA_017592 [Camellia sinensis var. sinensis]|uniref:Uncharacterized protein n=1 Tax=Camellia sinensis var. sinensis TaxID=542762 RepID=A0A4S4ERA8_CAMSN|nr:hypothetical protein TEA_017592 [Camellia sinensis var. sinensis]
MHWTEGKRPRVLEVREKGPRQRRSRTDETRDWVYGKEEGAKPIASRHVVIASHRVAFTTIIAIAIASLSLSFDLRLTLYENPRSRINKRGETVDEKIKKLDAELARYEEQIKKTRPGPAQEAVKARAMRVLKQKRTYEGQRDMLYNQTFNLDQVEFASEGIKDAKQTMFMDSVPLAIWETCTSA